MTSGTLWNYYRDEVNHDENENDNANNRINNNKAITSKSFEYKTKLIGRTPIDNNTLNAEVENIWVIFGGFLICHWLTVK